MKSLAAPGRAPAGRRGAALLLSFLVLIVVVAIVYQIHIVTSTDSKVAHADVTLTRMDLAIESALLQTYQMLADDAEADAAAPAPEEGLEGEAREEEEDQGTVDSRMDEWARPQSTTINEVDLRIVIQDEDSKYNVLNMLSADPELAEQAYERVVRILDRCREGTLADIDSGHADEMARAMRDHFLDRSTSVLPRALLLSDDPENENLGMPLTLRELVVLEPFDEGMFRDFFDVDGVRVHSIGSFLTCSTSPVLDSLGEGGATTSSPQGGFAVNVNTAPFAVLASLLDDRDVPIRFWEGVLEYRNEEEEPPEGEDEVEPILDEFGQEIVPRKFFRSVDELDQIYGWDRMGSDVQETIASLLTVSSSVFSIYATARLPTTAEAYDPLAFNTRIEREIYERSGLHLTRTVRSVAWRVQNEDALSIVPIVRWEVLDNAPLEVLDYEDE